MKSKATIKPLKPSELFTIRAIIFLGGLSIINFFYWFSDFSLIDSPWLFWALFVAIVYHYARIITLWYHYWSLKVPVNKTFSKRPTVDVLTTYFPGEPYEMIVETLEAIQKITYPHTTYLCDEANDPFLIEKCKELGVIHVTRTNRINAKAGNINNALKQATGEICLILDPDHVPYEDFLDQVIPYFDDPKIGFVQVVQSYYNIDESLVARGAAEQTYQFYGPMMICMNSYGTVNAIGANCTFRRAALDSIGGHAPGLSEDMHTAMKLHAKGWDSIYIPKVVAKGLSPASLTAYYKQQLKWSRGTFELLVSEYPKLFKNFSWRQKLHYGLIPMHYLSGVFYLINFLIPILSLFLATTPWKGNIVSFGLIYLPILASTFLIRSYIQKWVIETKERGFHLIGGLLQINTWWIFLLGLIYTIIRKKIPYLPTPKEGDEKTSWKLLIPNLSVALISITAIIYGLSIDRTPFSLFMAGFALLNAGFLFTTLLFAYNFSLKPSKTNFLSFLQKIVRFVRALILPRARRLALPLILISLFISLYAKSYSSFVSWEGAVASETQKSHFNYVGIFHPMAYDGLTDLNSVKKIENWNGLNFDIVSFYLAWGDTEHQFKLPTEIIEDIYQKNSVPMITWEPWGSTFYSSANNDDLKNEKKVLRYIADGHFDNYIKSMAQQLASYNRPVFIRFAHEFDNPIYPWSNSGGNSVSDFKDAWARVRALFNQMNAYNVIWVYNPWKAEAAVEYFPGEEYVDWIGITGLNYGTLNSNGQWMSFHDLYAPFNLEIKKLPKKPVMVAEMGSLKLGGNQEEWISQALKDVKYTFKEIKGVVFFNSSFDKNFSHPSVVKNPASLDWKLSDYKAITSSSNYKDPPAYIAKKLQQLTIKGQSSPLKAQASFDSIKGVNFKKGQQWYKDYYVLTRKTLLKDFENLKALKINTLKHYGPSVYDENVLSISSEFGLKTMYSFWINGSINFVTDTLTLLRLEKDILKAVKTHKNRDNIIGWNIGNDVLAQLDHYYNKPVLLHQQFAYTKWLDRLLSKIKIEDPSRPVSIDISTELGAQSRASFLGKYLQFDAFGIIATNKKDVQKFLKSGSIGTMPYFYSDVLVHDIFEDYKGVFVRNFQDQNESGRVSFDGLLDRTGKRYTRYYKLDSIWNGTKIPSGLSPKVKILKPAIAVYQGKALDYYALVKENDEWVFPDSRHEKTVFNWLLVKCDYYGNPIAIKDLGNSDRLTLNAPENHKEFLLALRAVSGSNVEIFITKLNTPLW